MKYAEKLREYAYASFFFKCMLYALHICFVISIFLMKTVSQSAYGMDTMTPSYIDCSAKQNKKGEEDIPGKRCFNSFCLKAPGKSAIVRVVVLGSSGAR